MHTKRVLIAFARDKCYPLPELYVFDAFSREIPTLRLAANVCEAKRDFATPELAFVRRLVTETPQTFEPCSRLERIEHGELSNDKFDLVIATGSAVA